MSQDEYNKKEMEAWLAFFMTGLLAEYLQVLELAGLEEEMIYMTSFHYSKPCWMR